MLFRSEAFDKVSKLLGFGYPGGPQIERAAALGKSDKISFPIADLKEPFNFSFSGLKTSVLRYVQNNYKDANLIPTDDKNDIAAAFQVAAVKALIKKVEKALSQFKVRSISLVGGVAANSELRKAFEKLSKQHNLKLVIPDFEFCGDNAAMIAFRGMKSFEHGLVNDLDFSPYPGLTPQHFS